MVPEIITLKGNGMTSYFTVAVFGSKGCGKTIEMMKHPEKYMGKESISEFDLI